MTSTEQAPESTSSEPAIAQVQREIARASVDFDAHPFFDFLRDTTLDPAQRLRFAPALAHFVMTFADLYRFVLREEPARDKYQEIVNAHTYEDGGHWKWFLADLHRLDHDPRVAFSDSLRFLWGEETVQLRMLSYQTCHLGLGASSLHKLVLVQCIEATGGIMLKNIAPVASALTARLGRNLVYFGAHHLNTENEHTLEQDDARHVLDSIEIDAALGRDLSALVTRAFAAFTATAGEMLAFAVKPSRIDRTAG